jgi:LysM repeat protein
LFLLIVAPAPASAAGYIVRPGDTLTTIAQRYGTSPYSLARANGIGNVNLLPVGRLLYLPGASVPQASTSSGTGSYQVRWGDTLSAIALRYGTTVAGLRASNPSLGSYLLAGSWLHVCSSCGSAGTAASSTGRYLVHPGDSLYSIAARYGVTPGALAAANGIANYNQIFIGSWLTIPGVSGGAGGGYTAPVQSSASFAYSGDARSLIISWARFYGLSPSLPLAIAWQESGYNQTLTSATGAIGVMQVEPYTGDVISRSLGRRMNLYNIDDNIHAGVYWLSQLLVRYGWNERMASAAYYEGSAAIARYGFFRDTIQYVNNVQALQARLGG